MSARAHVEQKLLHAGKLPVRQAGQHYGGARAVDEEDAEVERLEGAGRDGDGDDPGHDAACLHPTRISRTSSPMRRAGSVISCTCCGVTPGAPPTSFNPSALTSRPPYSVLVRVP